MKCKRMLGILTISLCFILVGCGDGGASKLYEEETKMEFYTKVTTAWNFTMESNVDLNEARFDIKDEKVKYDNVFLFATKEEADKAVADGKIGDNDIYAYGCESTQDRLDLLNHYVQSKELKDKLAEYDLLYPVTIEDLASKTISVRELILDRDIFTESEYSMIAR